MTYVQVKRYGRAHVVNGLIKGNSVRAARIAELIRRDRLTLLGIGPMSRVVVEEAVSLANAYKKPIALIPSRRQVDAAELGGGYVENWSTEAFAKFVRSIDVGGYTLLSRDHSGPWQGPAVSAAASLHDAMSEAKLSLTDDISCGFDLLHIDPSPALKRGFSDTDVLDMAVELIDHCCQKMQNKSQCLFEVGTDEQDVFHERLTVTEIRLATLLAELKKNDLPDPVFYVAQTGTKVVERRNIGSFDQPLTARGSLPASVYVPMVLDLLSRHGLFLKEHNADYLSDSSLRWHRKFGIHAANVAPEFGVRETLSIFQNLERLGMHQEMEEVAALAYNGRMWEKWMLPDSMASDMERSIIAGHYHFSSPEFINVRRKMQRQAAAKGWDAAAAVAADVRASINRYMQAFGYGR